MEATSTQPATLTAIPQLDNPGTPSSTGGAPVISGIRAVTFAAVALAIGCGATSWFAQRRYERFTGYLQARTHSVTCERDVRLVQIITPQGKAITGGAPLLKLDDIQLPVRILKQKQIIQDLTDEVAETEAKVQLAVERERNSIKREILHIKLKAAQLEKERFEKELMEVAGEEVGDRIKSVEALEVSAESGLERLPKPLVIPEEHFSDDRIRRQMQRKKMENVKETLLASIEMCNKHLAELKQKSNELPETVRRSMGLHRVQLSLENARTELASLEQQQQSLTISSPGTGVVGVYRKGLGSHIPAHEEIVQVLDEDQPQILLQIPSSRVADFIAGTIVELQFPGGKCGQGKVAEVPPQTVNAPGLNVAETQMAVQIVPSGSLWPRLPINTMIEIRRPR